MVARVSTITMMFVWMVELYRTLFAFFTFAMMWMTWWTRAWWNLLGTVARINSVMMLWTWTWWRFFKRRTTAVSVFHTMRGGLFWTGNKASWLGSLYLVFSTLTFSFSLMSYNVLHFIKKRLIFGSFDFFRWSFGAYTQLFLLPLFLTFGGLKIAHHH